MTLEAMVVLLARIFNLFGVSYLAKGCIERPALCVAVTVIVDLHTTSPETATQTGVIDTVVLLGKSTQTQS